MVVICEECGLKYHIDLAKVVGDRARFNCKGCSFSIIVNKKKRGEESDPLVLKDALLSAGVSLETEKSASTVMETKAVENDDIQEAGTGSVASATTELKERKRAGFGLTTKIVLLMLLASLLPGAICFGLFFQQTSEQIEVDTNKSGELVARLLAVEVDEWIDKNVRVLKTLASLPRVKSMSRFDQEVILQSLQAQYPWMYLAFTTNERAMNVARSDNGSLRDYSDRRYVKAIIGGAELAWQNLIDQASKKPALVIAVPIKSGEVTVGVLAAVMSRETISNLLSIYTTGQTGRSFLVDQTGEVIAHKDNAFVLRQQEISGHPLIQASTNKGSGKIEFVDADGAEAIGFAQTTKLGWILAIQQSKTEVFEPLKKAQTLAYMIFGITVVLILVIASFSDKVIVKPLRDLTEVANKMSIGYFDVEISTTAKDEIGDLANAIMRMQDSFRLSIARLSRKKRR